MIRLYTLLFGSVIMLIGIMDLIMPRRVFTIWHAWASKKLFFLHGILLIAIGFPLTVYEGPFSTFIFIIGIVVALSGPFLLIYPDKFRQMFQAASEELEDRNIKRIMYAEGAIRIAVGAVCAAAYFM